MKSIRKSGIFILCLALPGCSETKPVGGGGEQNGGGGDSLVEVDKPTDNGGMPSDSGTQESDRAIKIVHLDQGWSPETLNLYRSTGQGSLIVPFDWFLFLEQADSTDLFRSRQNIERFGYIAQESSESNPEGAPIGFVRSFDPQSKQHWVGLNCAACHTARIDYQGTTMLIEGAPTLGDFQTLIQELVSALKATLEDDAKFQRFAANVLGEKFTEQSSQDLKDEFSKVTAERIHSNEINVTKSRYGFGRLDAFGITFNNVAVDFLGVPENQIDPNAPASYPFIWGSLQSDYMQWVGSAPNVPVIGSILRATGEVWGTFGRLKMKPTETPGYASSAPFEDISRLLDCVEQLRSPEWPENILPEIDRDLASAGKVLYEKHCAHCHQVVSREQQGENYKAVLVPYKDSTLR